MASQQDRVTFLVAEKDRQRLDALCSSEEMTASALVRQLLRRRAIELGLEPSVRPQNDA